ncbi:hypothetical protein GWI33_018645 [Rhynchophorus ferrugineus]|uniref:Uncharacterized protein n=1 Tax=Rhynchophorus ferrugineus TaxID=354439 RepID=A0A834M2A3_RHYFE|nr:hypothetical protein GWI33_018645 [Rhynchophorus ferrugineus]
MINFYQLIDENGFYLGWDSRTNPSIMDGSLISRGGGGEGGVERAEMIAIRSRVVPSRLIRLDSLKTSKEIIMFEKLYAVCKDSQYYSIN